MNNNNSQEQIPVIGDWGLGIGDWGLGIGDWGLGIGPNPQSPNPQSPIPNPQSPIPKKGKNNTNKSYTVYLYIINILIIVQIYILYNGKSRPGKNISRRTVH